MLKIQIVIGTISVCLLLVIFELIRRRRLKEKYALLWLFSGFSISVFSIFPSLLDIIAKLLGMYYLTALFVLSFLFLLMIVLHFSTVISELSEKNKNLAQEIGILRMRLEEKEQLDESLAKNREELKSEMDY